MPLESLSEKQLGSLIIHQTTVELQECNELTGRYGLLLSENDMQEVAEHHYLALRDTGRVELGGGVLKKLAWAFCDSPYVTGQDYSGILIELLESFYYFKNESLEQFSDDELIEMMKRHFDGECQGSLEYLSGTTLEELCRTSRFRGESTGTGRRF